MSVDERTRRDMYTGLEAALGAPVADALMAHLPPTGWADVARTHDVAVLRGEMVAALVGPRSGRNDQTARSCAAVGSAQQNQDSLSRGASMTRETSTGGRSTRARRALKTSPAGSSVRASTIAANSD